MLIAWSVRWRQNSERGVEAVRQQVVELLQRAEQNLNAGRTAAARKNYETVLELNPAEPVALLFMAGYLQQEGVEAKFVVFDSSARMVAPLATGDIDVGWTVAPA